MSLVWTLGLNAAVGLGAWFAAASGFGERRGLPRGLAAVVIGWAWITLGMQILGPIGLLSRWPLLAWSLLGTALGLGLRLRERRAWHSAALARSEHNYGRSDQDLSETSGTVVAPDPEPGWDLAATIAVGLALWAAALFGARSLCLPVKVMSDGPIYHLWFAARWFQDGRLELVPTPFGDNVATYFPAIGDLWFAWLMIGWGGETLAKVGQAPFLALSAFAAYAIARELRIGRSAAALASSWLVTISPLIIFSFEANVDTILLGGYLAACLFFLRGVRQGRLGPMAVGALAAGCAWGCKPTGLLFVPPLLLGACLAFRFGPAARAARWRVWPLVCGLPLLLVGFWYGRSMILTGNPLYPLQVDLFGIRLLTGWFGRGVMRTNSYYINPTNWSALIDILLQVFDPRLAPLWLSALLGVWALGPRANSADSGKRGASAWVWTAVGLAFLNFAIYWGGIPYRTQQRFLLPAVGVAAIPLARLFDGHKAIRVVAVFLLALHVMTPQAWPWAGAGEESAIPWDQTPVIPNALPGLVTWRMPDRAWLASISEAADRGAWDRVVQAMALVIGPPLIGLAALGTAWIGSRSLFNAVGFPRRSGPRNLARLVGSLTLLFGLSLLVTYPWGSTPAQRFFPPYREYYRAWLTLDRLAGPDGARIAYAGTNLPYFLLGPGMKNVVRYVNINEHRDWMMHDYHRRAIERGRPNWPDYRPGWDRAEHDRDAWLENLEAEGIELLVIARHNPNEDWPIERRWVESMPERFRPVSEHERGDPLMRIYRFAPATSEKTEVDATDFEPRRN